MFNLLFYALVLLLLFGITGRLRASLWIMTGFFAVVGLLNYYVLSFRDTPIMPWDIYSIKTAASVASDFDYMPEPKIWAILLGFALLLLLEGRLKVTLRKKWFLRGILVLCPFLALTGYTNLIQSEQFRIEFRLYDKLFTPTIMNRRDGNIVAFLMEMEYLEVDKPEDYSASEVNSLLLSASKQELHAAVSDSVVTKRPNIIVIMNEAFSDPAVLLSELDSAQQVIPFSQDYMPFFHSLEDGALDNTVTGMLNVSVLGGNTANSEFEFLTGNTMAFLPPGSVPYQQYIHDEMPSLAGQLQSLGYSTVAIHPYNADGWERDRVYPLLGFERFISYYQMRERRMLRSYVSDASCYEEIIALYEEKEANKPLFVFNVTMQNHSSYTTDYNNLPVDVVADLPGAAALDRYASLLRRSDLALEELIHYFSEQEEETIILFFGDHQPVSSVTNPLLTANGISPASFSEENSMLKYKVPYAIWANFHISSDTNQETSLNYLALDILRYSGLPLTAYQTCLSDIREDFPIVSAQRIVDANGEEREVDELDDYHQLQYYRLFDEE
jgi:phosphoglycerol transferase MdoB-like AlkP superfamily enzyme